MSEVLLKWLNDDVKLSEQIEPNQFASFFSNGYLIGELLHVYGLQDDFHSFSRNQSSEAKLNNFSRIEPTMALLNVKFDTNMAREIINERPGMATRLLYQLFISLGKKTKMNLTGFAMETMRSQGPARLGVIETEMYKERLKTLVPRQVDIDFHELVTKYSNKRKENDEKALKSMMIEEENWKTYKQNIRQQGIERSRQLREKQDDIMTKIKEATVKIPKPTEKKKTSGLTKKEYKKKSEIEGMCKDIEEFEKHIKHARSINSPQSSDQIRLIDADIEMFLNESPTKSNKISDYIKPGENEDYISKIRQRLNDDLFSRKEREKRRRRVLVNQLQAHQAQQESAREDELLTRMMRQSQVERRIAVQLMHIRHEKEVIKKNRMEKERQFTERRLQDFQDALDREAEMCRLARIEYAEEVQKNKEIHDAIARERAQKKYDKHYGICKETLLDIVDFTCKVGEYRELTEKLLPPKLVREWKALFMNSQPLYLTENREMSTEQNELLTIEGLDQKQSILDEDDFMEYKNYVGEWLLSEASGSSPPQNNAILGVVLARLNKVLYPPSPLPDEPIFPAFPIKACVLGKFFSGKTSAIRSFAADHRVVVLDLQEVVEDALQAWNDKEQVSPTEVDKDEVMITNVPEEESEIIDSATGVEANMLNDESKKQDHSRTSFTVVEEANYTLPVTLSQIDETGIPKEEAENSQKHNSSIRLSACAVLGGKASSYLRKSKIVPDSLLVNIMVNRIRNIPSGTGWVMDGFPANIHQAKLLEKALTGYEAISSPRHKSATRDLKKWRKSRIAPDPTPVVEAKQPVSGLNVVLLFNVSNEVVLKRAEGRKYDVINGQDYHEEFYPPPEGSYTGMQSKSKVQSVIDLSNDKEQAQIRITTFQDNWSKLEKWFQKFNVLHQIDADIPKESLATKLKEVLEDTLEKLKSPQTEIVDVLHSQEILATELPEDQVEKDVEKEQVLSTELHDLPEEPTVASSKVDVLKETATKSVTTKGKRNNKVKDSPSKTKEKEPSTEKKGKKTEPSPAKKQSDSTISIETNLPTQPQPQPETDLSTVIEEPTPSGTPQSPVPGTAEWTYVEESIDPEFVEILLTNWNIVEEGYVRSCKHVFRNIRHENENVVQYFYNTRKYFFEFLKRPDAKQIFMSEWQKDYNAFPQDMRNDEEAKEELHERVNDLCDRLWDICDTRKDEAEQERNAIIAEGWLEDHIGILVNHFISLMQAEVDRYQQTCNMLKDYYVAMEGAILKQKPVKLTGETIPTFTRLALVELLPTKSRIPSAAYSDDGEHAVAMSPLSPKPSSAMSGSRPPVKLPEVVVEERGREGRIPLVPKRPNSTEASPTRKRLTPRKDRSSEDRIVDTPSLRIDLDEKLLINAVTVALAVVEDKPASDSADDNNETSTLQDVPKPSSKDRKNKRKSPKPRGQVHRQTSAVPISTVVDVKDEDQIKVKKMKKEYKHAVQIEGVGLQSRLEAIKSRAIGVVRMLKEKAERTHVDLDNWLGKRFLDEMESTDNMCEVVRQAIENEEQLQNATVLEDKEFFIDDDLHVFKTPTPPRLPSPKEEIYVNMFTCTQLNILNKQFQQISPSDMVPVKLFNDVILSLSSSTVGMEAIPEMWMNITQQQLKQLSSIISIRNEYVNRKMFMLEICKPYPEPTLEDLLETARNLRAEDGTNLGFVRKGEFLKCQIWLNDYFNNESVVGYNRLQNLKQIFFHIFATEKAEGYLLDYMDMLLYFVHGDDAMEGLIAALSVVTGEIISLPFAAEEVTEEQKDDTVKKGENQLLTSVPDEVSPVEDSPVENSPVEDVAITIDQWITVFTHGKRGHGGDHRFNIQQQESREKIKEILSLVYDELGYTYAEAASFQLLYAYPVMRDLMNECTKYQTKDISGVFKPGIEE